MKVMISQPMRGKTHEQIKKEREEVIEKLQKMHIEIIDSLFDYEIEDESINKPVYYLGDAIKKLSEADALLCMDGWDMARGCRIERQVAQEYGIKILCMDFFENPPEKASEKIMRREVK